MKIVQHYIAEDGLVFSDKLDCERHEFFLKNVGFDVKEEVTMWNKYSRLTDDINDADFIMVKTDRAADYICRFSSLNGRDSIDSRGFYAKNYFNVDGSWDDIGHVIETCVDALDSIGFHVEISYLQPVGFKVEIK